MKSAYHRLSTKATDGGFCSTMLPSSLAAGAARKNSKVSGPRFNLTEVSTGLFALFDMVSNSGQNSLVVTSHRAPIATLHFHRAGENRIPPAEGEILPEVFAGNSREVVVQAVRACVDSGKPTELVLEGREGRVVKASVCPCP